MKSFVTQVVEYHGECPRCHRKQVNKDPENVDVKCWWCNHEEAVINYRNQCRNELIGATIEEVRVGSVDSDFKPTVLCVRLTDGELRQLAVDRNVDGAPFIDIEWMSEETLKEWKEEARG